MTLANENNDPPADEHDGQDLPEYTHVTGDGPAPTRSVPVEDGASGPAKPPHVHIEGYAIVREISRGGQAVVYQGVQESTGRRVAVKVMAQGPFATEDEKARFEREVQILAALEHPNIVSVIDRGTTAGGAFYFIMEYVEGLSLDEHVDDYHVRCGEVPDDPSELLRLFMEICEAVNAAHLRGVVHRDLKPANIRIDPRGEPRIVDFGLARAPLSGRTGADGSRPVTVTGQFLGSLPYASPEQAEGVPSMIDPRTDVYSLGVILYRMLTNQFPYQVVGNMRDVLDNIMRAKPTPPSTVVEAQLARRAKTRRRRLYALRNPINETIEAIVLKALAKKRKDRYQSAGEFSRDIANYLAGRATLAAGKPRRPLREIVSVVAVAVVCIAAVMGVVLWPVLRSPEPSSSPPKGDGLVLDLPGGVTMKLALIPAGKFRMGSPPLRGEDDEQPQRLVTISKPFYIGLREVTQRQWKAVMRVRPWEGRDYGVGADDRPANWISYSNATVFCAKLSHMTKRTVRLPTEAEWEYACRAGSTSDYCFGDDDDQLEQYAWYGWKTPDAKAKCPRPVARKKPNAWGLYDMHGNVWEWCSDWYDRDYYRSTGAEVVDPAGSDSGTDGVLRGGAWHNIPANLRAAKRMEFAKDSDCRSGGLRVVVEVRPPR